LLAEILWMGHLHPDILMYQVRQDEIINLFNVCHYALKGFTDGSLQKMIYKKTVTPQGKPVQYVERKQRKIWFCLEDQPLR
jgi:hypothetical protein